MLALAIKINEKDVCLVNGSDIDFIAAKYSVARSSITIEVMSLSQSDSDDEEFNYWLNQSLEKKDKVEIKLLESEKSSFPGNKKLDVPVKQVNIYETHLRIKKNKEELLNQLIQGEECLEISVVCNIKEKVYYFGIVLTGVNEGKKLEKKLDADFGDTFLIELC